MLINEKIESGIITLLKNLNTPPQSILYTEYQAYLTPLKEFELQLKKQNKQAVIFGAFKAGKSTLINALLGSSWLPSRSNRATGVPTHIVYHHLPAAWVNHSQLISPEQIGQYILLDTSQGSSEAPDGVQSVKLGLPLPLLKNQWSLVDTPGLLDNATLSEVTLQQLQQADLAIVVLLASKLLAEAEREVIQQVNTLLKGNLVIIINQIDQIDLEERELLISWANSCLTGIGNRLVGFPALFTTAAKAWLKQDEPEMLETRIAFQNHMKMIFYELLGNRVALLSRLSILESHLQERTAYFKIQLLNIKQQIQKLELEAEEDLKHRQITFNKLIEEITCGIDLMQVPLITSLAQMEMDCCREVKFQIDKNNPEWLGAARGQINNAANAYIIEVKQKSSVILNKIKIVLPIFNREALDICQQASISEDLATRITKTIGKSEALGFIRGAAKVFSLDLKQKNLEKVKSLLQKCVYQMRQNTQEYIDNLHSLVADYQVVHQPKREISDKLKNAYQNSVDYEKFINWISSCRENIQPIIEEVMSVVSEFEDIWDKFTKLAVSEFMQKRQDKKNKKIDLNQLANQVIKENCQTRWDNPSHYNYAWLEKLKRENYEVGQELSDLIHSVSINKLLNKKKLIDRKEVVILVITIVLSLVILLWGQNIQDIRVFSFSRQSAISMIILSWGYFFMKKSMDERDKKFERNLHQTIKTEIETYKLQAINILKRINF
ncbi:dynamin family protein [Anabaena sp. CCY 0017]|uniref:dynamin family protein n=1 Tax=Anabaena sp. CCY 0017 TaxID=3103866 RepID=UPI0039C5D016